MLRPRGHMTVEMSEEQKSGSEVIHVCPGDGGYWIFVHGGTTEQFATQEEALIAAQARGRATGAAVTIDAPRGSESL